MKVKDVLIQSAFLLGKTELAEFIEKGGSDEDLQREQDLLLRCYNIVENEIALDYVPLTAEETVNTENGAVLFSSFARAPVSVISVTDLYGNPVPYTVYPEYIRFRAGESVVTYAYSPEEKYLSDESAFDLRISLRLLAYGVACEFSLIDGEYEEAVVWDKKYKDALLVQSGVSRGKFIRSRRWV